MRSMLAAVALWLLAGSAVAYEVPPQCQKKVSTIENIERVFMHRPFEYSFLVQEKEGVFRLVTVSSAPYEDYVRFIVDVPADKPMWVKVNDCTTSFSIRRFLEIHIRAAANVEGAGWSQSHGKTTSYGTTVPIR